MTTARVAILGTAGVPGNYGGFETLAENLVRYHQQHGVSADLSVYCSEANIEARPKTFLSGEMRYLSLDANGAQSILYDAISLFDAARKRDDVVLLLGVSGALSLPLVRLFSRMRIITNIDGIEWKREKWRGLARGFLRWSEWAAVRWSHAVVADNVAIADHVRSTYGYECHVIPYGGDHALAAEPSPDPALKLPKDYALGLCRIEPENNVEMILDAFSRFPERPIVFVGNWNRSRYGRGLKARFAGFQNIYLIDPIYSSGQLRWVREGAVAYVHGHSAGGTNPSLVEMMHFGIPVFAHGCTFNRHTTDDAAIFFETADELARAVETSDPYIARNTAERMREIARRRFTWAHIGAEYFELLLSGSISNLDRSSPAAGHPTMPPDTDNERSGGQVHSE